MKQESLFIPINNSDELHLRRIYRDPEGEPIFLLHGSIENGRIFYSESGKGLGPYLAQAGFDVYVGDLRGRGLSRPPIGRHSRYGQTEAILEDLPAFLSEIRRRRGRPPRHWVAHSWGGVLLMALYARSPEWRAGLESVLCFGTKRRIAVFNREKFLKIDLFWNLAAPLLARIYGYLPMVEWKMGSDNETASSLRQNRAWVKAGSPWVDPQDGFDYGEALRSAPPPPTFHFAAIKDAYLGHPEDVQDFIRETKPRGLKYHLLSRENGQRHDYGHIDMLTHPDAPQDHFPMALDWLKGGFTRRG
ncbi:MAG TPA: alpha/beta fold hydrolase [bacterium]|nr:alpha/beta fold hydrolase [bacterium]